jgi:hypothetical protein
MGLISDERQPQSGGSHANELRVSASRSRCRNSVGLNAVGSALQRGSYGIYPMEFSFLELDGEVRIAGQSEWSRDSLARHSAVGRGSGQDADASGTARQSRAVGDRPWHDRRTLVGDEVPSHIYPRIAPAA